MDHVEAAPNERVDRKPVGDPRGEANEPFDGLGIRCSDSDRTTHREANEERSFPARLRDSLPGVFDAPVEPTPRFDAVAHFGKPNSRTRWRESFDQQLKRRAPRSFDQSALSAVDADDSCRRWRVGDAHFGTAWERNDVAH